MKISLMSIMLGIALFASGVANAAVVYWTPTNADVNFVNYTTAVGYDLGLFDVDDFDTTQTSPLMLDPLGNFDTIAIAADGGNFSATSSVTGSSITLYNDNQFVLAIRDVANNWFEPLTWFEPTPNTNVYSITFTNGVVLSVDAAPTIVPVPAAVWLFGSGLLGMVAVARRKKIA